MPDDSMALYPLKFEPIYKEKVWGGRKLETLGRALPGGPGEPGEPGEPGADTLIGESWDLVDLGQTSASGGGGGGGGDAERSVVVNGPLAGATVNELMHRFGPRLMGRLTPTPTDEFPLLIKFIDASENLSVQVHPSEEYAAAHDDAFVKTEAWYIIDAEPDSCIYKGVGAGVTATQFRSAIEANDAAAFESLLIKVPARPGKCHFLPSGTCHALGKGILIAEVQMPSDTTFRVFDWGRTGRELHIEQALQCIEFGPPEVAAYEKRSHIAGMFTTITRLIQCDHFRIEKVRMSEGYEQEIPYDQPTVWMVLQGKGTITPGNSADPVDFQRGQTMLLPADMPDATIALHEDTVWLEITFPQTMLDQIA